MSQGEPVDGPIGEYRKDTIKKLEMENEVDTPNNDTGNESVSSDLVLIALVLIWLLINGSSIHF